MRLSPGCNCCACNWTITVHGCSSANISSATVELKQSGTTIASGITNGSGVIVLDAPAGTYDIVVTPPTGSGYATSTTSGVAHTCDQSTTITLSPDADHMCGGVCCPNSPTTIAVTFSGSTLTSGTLTWDGAANLWHDDYTHTHFFTGDRLFRYEYLCLSVSNVQLSRRMLDNGASGAIGTGVVSSCAPYASSGGSGIFGGTWSGVG